MTYSSNKQYQAYQDANQTINPTEQIIMLYEGAIGFVKKAKEAIETEDYETKYNMTNKVLAITAALTSELEFNEETRETAEALDIYYQALELKLLNIQCNDSLEDCDIVIRDLQTMLNAWKTAAEQNHAQNVSEEISNQAETEKLQTEENATNNESEESKEQTTDYDINDLNVSV